jgi:hypothetical protein
LELLFRTLDGKSDADLRRDAAPLLAAYLEQARQDNNKAAIRILEGGYADRLDRGELIGLLMRDRRIAP